MTSPVTVDILLNNYNLFLITVLSPFPFSCLESLILVTIAFGEYGYEVVAVAYTPFYPGPLKCIIDTHLKCAQFSIYTLCNTYIGAY